MPAPDDWSLVCQRCGAALRTGEGSFYVVRVEAFADPSPPIEVSVPLDAQSVDELLRDVANSSPQELMDQVYRRLEFKLCASCYSGWIERPAGA